MPLDHFRADHTEQDLPKGGAYYVLDSRGSLLYYSIPFEATEEELAAAPGMTKPAAAKVYRHFHGEEAQPQPEEAS